MVKNLPTEQETWVQSLSQEDLLKGMATHSSILPWKIPQTEESYIYMYLYRCIHVYVYMKMCIVVV